VSDDGVHADDPVVDGAISKGGRAPIIPRHRRKDGGNRQVLKDLPMGPLRVIILAMELGEPCEPKLAGAVLLQDGTGHRLWRCFCKIHEQDAAFVLGGVVSPLVEQATEGRIRV
jgi:hypothetical protein